MDNEFVRSYEGSPRPADIFQPHMPDVDLLSNMDAFFAAERSRLVLADPPLENQDKGQRYVSVITPGRAAICVPCAEPGTLTRQELKNVTQLMPPNRALDISVISYNFVQPLLSDVTDANNQTMIENMNQCIPFFGFLLVFGYIGHSVIVFEGHHSAFESGVRASDVLLVDSAMVPFLQADWLSVAERVMRPDHRIFIHNREDYTLSQLVKRDDARETSQRKKKWWKWW